MTSTRNELCGAINNKIIQESRPSPWIVSYIDLAKVRTYPIKFKQTKTFIPYLKRYPLAIYCLFTAINYMVGNSTRDDIQLHDNDP